jgi:hypothetical protein
MTMEVRCPDCGDAIEVRRGAESGDLLECPNCAGHALRLKEVGARWGATLAYRVSSPNCAHVLTLPEDAEAGETIQCCGRRYRLTLEYGAFAAEDV